MVGNLNFIFDIQIISNSLSTLALVAGHREREREFIN